MVVAASAIRDSVDAEVHLASDEVVATAFATASMPSSVTRFTSRRRCMSDVVVAMAALIVTMLA